MIIELSVLPLLQDQHADTVGLLLNEPPDTARQTFVGFATSGTNYEILHEEVSGQRGYLFRGEPGLPRKIDLHFEPAPGRHRSQIFTDFDNGYTRLDVGVSALCRSLSLASEDASVQAIAAAIGRKFEYGSRNATMCLPRLFPGIAQGNCIDINTLFLACLRSLRHRASYLAGYYFPASVEGATADGMHCWIAVDDGAGQREWDIAHCQQAGLAEPVDLAEPLGGTRVAISYGRGLSFAGADRRLAPISHGARPHWVMADGSVVEASVEAKLVESNRLVTADPSCGNQTHIREMQSCVSAHST